MDRGEVEREVRIKAKQRLGTRRPPCQATMALRAQDRGPGSGWVIQACLGAGWLSDSAQPHLASPAYLAWEWVAEAGGTGVLLGRR